MNEIVSPAIQTVVVDKSVSVVRFAADLPFVGGLRFEFGDLGVMMTLFVVAFVYLSAGRAHWLLICQSDARVNPELHAECEFQYDLRNGGIGAHVTKLCFIVLWPLWMAIGWLNAIRESVTTLLVAPRSR